MSSTSVYWVNAGKLFSIQYSTILQLGERCRTATFDYPFKNNPLKWDSWFYCRYLSPKTTLPICHSTTITKFVDGGCSPCLTGRISPLFASNNDTIASHHTVTRRIHHHAQHISTLSKQPTKLLFTSQHTFRIPSLSPRTALHPLRELGLRPLIARGPLCL